MPAVAPQSPALTPQSLPGYLARKGYIRAGEKVTIRTLGGGVSNVVFLVEWTGEAHQRWVVKQSLGKLRVRDDWRSERERIFREAEAIGILRGVLGSPSLPEIIGIDRANYTFIMTAAPAGSETWKSLLLKGRVDLRVARQAAVLLADLMKAGRDRPALRRQFEDRKVFDQLRTDPYYRTTAARHSELRPAYEALIADSLEIRTSLVHGDFSPKNMLVNGRNIWLIDFEAVHWGDPAFDTGFLLNHLLLKAFYQPPCRARYFEAAREFWRALQQHAGPGWDERIERMTFRHLGALMLARVDGKSPVEYIRDEPTKERVRQTARRILLEPPAKLEEAVSIVEEKLGGLKADC
jgi:5-methylthioribose kinase